MIIQASSIPRRTILEPELATNTRRRISGRCRKCIGPEWAGVGCQWRFRVRRIRSIQTGACIKISGSIVAVIAGWSRGMYVKSSSWSCILFNLSTQCPSLVLYHPGRISPSAQAPDLINSFGATVMLSASPSSSTRNSFLTRRPIRL